MILRAMILEDKEDMTTVLEYVSYLTKITRLAQAFRWESLVRYDTEYRKSQVEVGFRWGADSPYLFQLYLQPHQSDFSKKTNKPHQTQRNNQPAQARYANKYDPSSGKIICRKYNSAGGCDLRGCKFRHVCTTCYADHPDCGRSGPESTQASSYVPTQIAGQGR